MNFSMVWNYLINGQPMRRGPWPKDQAIFIGHIASLRGPQLLEGRPTDKIPRALFIVQGDELSTWQPSAADLFAEDWDTLNVEG